MKRAITLFLLVLIPHVGLAQRDRSGGGARAPQPVSRPAPVSRPQPQPQARAAPPARTGGFNFNHDTAARPPAQKPAVTRPPVQTRVPQPIARGFHGPAVHNPHMPNRPWNWNHGVAWVPAPIYWGGGFWGPWALANLSTAVFYGAFVDADNTIYQSYQVEPNSPGAEVLADYGLQQTPCGPPNLVVIWGPDNSVICAFPNAMVGPGSYQLDPSTLTLVSQ